MAEDIEIEYARGRIGSITFGKTPRPLHTIRTASGFELQLPIEITMRVRLSEEPMAMLSNLRGNVLVKTSDGSRFLSASAIVTSHLPAFIDR